MKRTTATICINNDPKWVYEDVTGYEATAWGSPMIIVKRGRGWEGYCIESKMIITRRCLTRKGVLAQLKMLQDRLTTKQYKEESQKRRDQQEKYANKN